MNNCPICNTQTTVESIAEGSAYNIYCTRCGKFEVTDSAITMFQNSEINTKPLSLSYWIRQHQTKESKVIIDLNLMRKLLINFEPPKPREQSDNLLLWIGSNVKKPDAVVIRPFNDLISIVGAVDEANVIYLSQYLNEQKYIVYKYSSTQMHAQMTFNGWDRYYELQRSNKESQLAFMAMKYGNETLDKIFNTVIKEAVDNTGFEIRILSEVKRSGLIDDKLRIEIRRSKFLIADLTDGNNGAYWEAGYAEGLGMPVIYICEKSVFDDKAKSTHFDTNHHLTVPWEDTEEGLKIFADELKATIRATLPVDAKMED
ncbi:MAG: hypothetical protein P4L35_03090 [Ignavibacteriaceae bacterium]|nr:hypothetical protein [Ignavibacteriaceae bacterium]